MKKSVIFGLVLLLMTSFVFAATNGTNGSSSSSTNFSSNPSATTSVNLGVEELDDEDEKISAAYTCLRNEVKNKSTLSFQEAVFTLMAIGDEGVAKKIVKNEKGANCWPESRCTLKETAQVILAYDRIGMDTADAEKWIRTKNGTVNELNWFLEIDSANHIPASCSIRFSGREERINIRDDMTLEGNFGSCLSVSSSGYWLRVEPGCIDKEYQISCDQDFVSTVLYQKASGGTVYVSSETHSAAAEGTTKEKIDAYCFKGTSGCDYEGTLWAAYALDKKDYDVSRYLPYLVALADDNKQYFPSAMLYSLTAKEDQYSTLVQSLKSGKFWEITASPYNKYYDSSLGLIGLRGSSSDQAQAVKNYFISIQTPKNCWNNNNIRDTAFLLYSGWPRYVGGSSDGGNGTSTQRLPCEKNGNYCSTSSYLCSQKGGVSRDSLYVCSNPSQFCCSVSTVDTETCTQKRGSICPVGQQCSVSTIPAFDGNCCLGTCEDIPASTDTCSTTGGSCKSECSSSEQTTVEGECSANLQCCIPKTSSGNGLLWFLLIGTITLLAVLAYLLRDKIKLWWFKFNNKPKSEPVTRPLPPAMPMTGYRPPMRTMRPSPGPAASRPVPKDKELEDTLKKLKEMSE
jgi:hypothetical protein